MRLSSTLADSRYYFYYFRSPVGRLAIESIIEQVAAAGIRGSDLRRLKVPYPPVPVQASIADILSALDDKIAANDRIIDVHEQILTARFDELCIDVDHSHEPEVPATELIEFNPRIPAARSSDAVYLDMSAVPTSSARIRQWCRREPKSGTRFMNYDTVMARITPCLENGKVGFIDFMSEGEVGVGSTEFIVMRARPGIPIHLTTTSRSTARSPTNARGAWPR